MNLTIVFFVVMTVGMNSMVRRQQKKQNKEEENSNRSGQHKTRLFPSWKKIRPTITRFAKSNEKYFLKVGGRFLAKRDSVEELEKIILKDFIAYHKQLEKDAEIKKQERFDKLVVRREDNWQDWWVREEKLISDFPGKIKKWEEKHKTSTHQYRDTKLKNYIRAVGKNLEYHQNRIHKGEVVEFQCKKCEEVFPFYEFRFDETGKMGRRGKCRECDAINKTNPEKAKAARQKKLSWKIENRRGVKR